MVTTFSRYNATRLFSLGLCKSLIYTTSVDTVKALTDNIVNVFESNRNTPVSLKECDTTWCGIYYKDMHYFEFTFFASHD